MKNSRKTLKKIQLPASILKELNSKSQKSLPKKTLQKTRQKTLQKEISPQEQEYPDEFSRMELEKDNLQEIFDFDFRDLKGNNLELSDSEFLKEKRSKTIKVSKEKEIPVVSSKEISLEKSLKKLQDSPIVASDSVSKRILNKLTLENIEFSLKEILKLFQENSRRKTSCQIIHNFLEISKQNLTNLQFIVLNGFFSLIFQTIGLEFGSLLIEEIILDSQNSEALQKLSNSNSCVSLSYLYIFNVISCRLIYDLIKKCLEKLEETDVEVLLKILRITGQKIRNDDPNALKEIIEILNSKLLEKEKKSTRLKFMADSIMDLKNNRVRRKFDQNDDITRVKKFIQNYLVKNSISQIEPLRIGISDIFSIGDKGRWWLVGSAWAGTENINSPLPVVSADSQQLLSLARSQKMNTDVRKTIFVTIMSSEDFIDAYEKLQKLGLKDKQEREIVRVIMHCCLQERIYNPYYSYLAQRFCEYAYSFKITLQYSLWDIFKSVEEDDESFQGIDGVRKMSNLGRFFLHLLLHKAVPISILKSLTFTSLAKLNALFCQIVVGGVICHSSSKSQKLIKDIFVRMKDTSTEAKEGLLFFIKQYLSPEKLEQVLKPVLKTDVRQLSLNLPVARTILEGGRVI